MLGGRSLFREMDEDPFFAGHREHMRMMESMFQSPFGGMGHPMLEPAGGHRPNHVNRHTNVVQPRQPQQQLSPFDMFGNFDSMLNNMRSMMGNMQTQMMRVQNDPNSHCYQQSSFVSYSNTGQGEPKMYQATASTRTAPGGVRETRKSVKDSTSGLEKMAVGHHIGSRGHVIEKSRNRRTGDQDDNEELINLDENEKSAFNHEWKQKTSQYHGRNPGQRIDYARRGERSHEHRGGRNDRLAIESPRERRPHFRDRE